MDMYEKYDRINENIEVFKLDNDAIMHFRDMYGRLTLVREKSALGNLTEEDERERKTLMADLDSFIDNFVKTRKEVIENEIEKFRRQAQKVNNKFESIKASFILGIGLDVNIPEMIKELEKDLEYLIGEAKALIALVDEFKNAVMGYTEVEFTMNYSDVQRHLDYLKSLMREIKQNQIDKYNARVSAINDDIEELKGLSSEELDKLPQEIRDRIVALQVMDICNITITSYNNMKYMEALDYDKLVKMLLEISEIKRAMGKEEEQLIDVDLDAEIDWIEDRIQEIESKFKDDLTKEEIEELQKEIVSIAEKTVEFEVKINNLKERLGEKFDGYFGRVNDAQANLAELDGRLNGLVKAPVSITDEYKFYLEKLNLLEGEVNSFSSLIESLFGKVLVDALSVLQTRYNTLNGRLEEIEMDIEKAYEEKKLDQNQYEQLKLQVERIRKTLNQTQEKLKNPEMARDVDVFAFLNGTIDGIERALEALEQRVESLEKPIKDKNVRKEIDRIIKHIEKEIKDVEKMLEKYKDQDPEKYEAAKERLEGLKERLDKVGKNYRKKCPLLIRAVKSAKEFYKKHKKMCLIIAGLAAIALVHATVGPILIPAIMHGNMMIGASMPALSGFTSFVNNILGGMVGAVQKFPGMWYLANGVRITPNMASVSLLKGLAISGLGSAALLAPLTAGVVLGVKKLRGKMANAEKKDKVKVAEKIEKGKEKLKKGKAKVSEKIEKIKNKKNKTDKETLNELKELLVDFRNSGKSFDEYCVENELTEEQKVFLEYCISKEKKDENTRKGGR